MCIIAFSKLKNHYLNQTTTTIQMNERLEVISKKFIDGYISGKRISEKTNFEAAKELVDSNLYNFPLPKEIESFLLKMITSAEIMFRGKLEEYNQYLHSLEIITSNKTEKSFYKELKSIRDNSKKKMKKIIDMCLIIKENTNISNYKEYKNFVTSTSSLPIEEILSSQRVLETTTQNEASCPQRDDPD